MCQKIPCCEAVGNSGNGSITDWGWLLQGIQDAYVTITLVDGKGNVIGRPQDTPTTNNLAGNHVLFNCEVRCLSLSLTCNASIGCIVGLDSEMLVAERRKWLICFQVHVQQGIESIPRTSALFFEFKRWKPNKEMIASKAYCFIDWDQLNSLQPGKCALEVYKSPADLSRKTKPSLLSVKPLYLHLIASTQVA